MRQIALFIVLLSLISPAAEATRTFPEPYLNQSSHRQTLFRDGWTGAYLESLYVNYTDTVLFEYCRPSENRQQFHKECRRVNKKLIPWTNLDIYERKLAARLLTYRSELESQLNENFFSRLLGGASADGSLRALNAYLAATELEPLKFMILMGPERRDREVFGSIRVLDQVVKIWQEIFSIPLKEPSGPAIADLNEN